MRPHDRSSLQPTRDKKAASWFRSLQRIRSGLDRQVHAIQPSLATFVTQDI
jgi:hypothetical protein